VCVTTGQLLHSDRSSSSEHSSSSSGRTGTSSRGFFGETAYPSGLFQLQVDLPQGGTTACITTPGAAAGAAVAGTCGVHSMWSWVNTDTTVTTTGSTATDGASLMSFWHTAESPAHGALLLSHSDWAVHAAPAYTAPVSRKRATAASATTAAGAAALHRQAVKAMSDSPPVRWTLRSGELVLLVPDRSSGTSSGSSSGSSSRSDLCIAVPDSSSNEGTCSVDGDDSSSDGEHSAVELKLQPAALRGCATVKLKPLPPILLQGGDGFGQCLAVTAEGHTWVGQDMHNPKLRWSVAPASVVSCWLIALCIARMFSITS
jgi:hypothetical protein